MKKITLLVLIFVSFVSNAQVISNDFETGLGWTVAPIGSTPPKAGAWARVTSGNSPTVDPYAGVGMAVFTSNTLSAGRVYALTSPSFTLVGTETYKVKFKMFRDGSLSNALDKLDFYLTPTATTLPNPANLLGTINRSITQTPVVSENDWYTFQFNIPASTDGVRFLRIIGTSQFGANIYIDNVTIEKTITNDASLLPIEFESVFVSGPTKTISGKFSNFGSNTINSATINWQVNEGEIFAQNLEGINLASSGTFNFSHPITWNPTPGLYNLRVWISNINGSEDNYPIDNEFTKSVNVASRSTAIKPLFEKFTSSTCGPCGVYNDDTFIPFYTPQVAEEMNLINYHGSFPSPGDPYFLGEQTQARYDNYGINAVPDFRFNGFPLSHDDLQSDLNDAKADPGYFILNATKNLVGTTMNVSVTTTPYLSGPFKLHVAVLEKMTTGNVGTNGETSFKNIIMKMMPDGNGTTLNCVIDTPIITNLSADMSIGSFVEEYTDLEVIVFVEDVRTKNIFQSFKAQAPASTDSFEIAKIKVFPNPSNGIVTISTDLATDVEVLDIMGKTVYRFKAVTNQKSLDLSTLTKGVYMLKMNNENGIQTEKIILK